MIHSCGKERILIKWCAEEETDLNCINPLEIAPMGDCDLAEIKQSFGSRLALMGNLHTTPDDALRIPNRGPQGLPGSNLAGEKMVGSSSQPATSAGETPRMPRISMPWSIRLKNLAITLWTSTGFARNCPCKKHSKA